MAAAIRTAALATLATGLLVLVGASAAGEQARVQVNFGRAGEKWLMLAYANLQLN